MKTIELILKQHGVHTTIIGNMLFAFDEWTLNGVHDGKWLEATKWTVKECYSFLGY